MISFKTKSLLTLTTGTLIASLGGCGTGTSEGYCKPAKNSGYVAATEDIDGKAWTLSITPETQKITCYTAGDKGTVRLFATIKDSMGIAKGGLSIAVDAPKSAAFTLSSNDPNTDSCGTAMAEFTWACPSISGEQVGGTVVFFSGALRGQAELTISRYVPASGLAP